MIMQEKLRGSCREETTHKAALVAPHRAHLTRLADPVSCESRASSKASLYRVRVCSHVGNGGGMVASENATKQTLMGD